MLSIYQNKFKVLLVLFVIMSFIGCGSVGGEQSIILDDTIYVGSSDNNIYALDKSGNLKWRYTTGGGIYSSPIIGSDGTIYVRSDDYNLYAFNSDGTLRWSYDAEGWIYQFIVSDKIIYIVNWSRKNITLLNLDGSFNRIFSTFPNQDPSYFEIEYIAIDSNILYVGCYDGENGEIYAFNINNGILEWIYPNNLRPDYLTVDSNHNIYIGYSDQVYSISSDGIFRWSYETVGVITSLNISSNSLYIENWWLDLRGRIYRLDLDGNLKKIYKIDDDISSYAIGKNGIYITTYGLSFDDPKSDLYVFDFDGNLKWKYQVIGSVYSITVGSDNTVYVGNYNGNLYAINDNILKWVFETNGSECSPTIHTEFQIL